MTDDSFFDFRAQRIKVDLRRRHLRCTFVEEGVCGKKPIELEPGNKIGQVRSLADESIGSCGDGCGS